MAWIRRWRERVIDNDSEARREQREGESKKVQGLKARQLAMTKKIQFHEEEYDRKVQEASLRKAPTQNGSARRKFLDFAHAEHSSELALRPPDRQIYSRFYSKVDNLSWLMAESRAWYNSGAKEDDQPDLPLEHYGFTAAGIPGAKRLAMTRESGKPPVSSNPWATLVKPMESLVPRQSISQQQARIAATQRPETSIHWSRHDLHLEHQKQKREQNPKFGNLEICAPPFRPLRPKTVAASTTTHMLQL